MAESLAEMAVSFQHVPDIWISRWHVDSLLLCVYVTAEEVAGGTTARRRKASVELKPRGEHVRAASQLDTLLETNNS